METFDISKYAVTDYYVYIGEAQNYLAGLYYQTGEKYRSQAVKIELLLSIYQLWCLKYNKTGLMPNSHVKFKIRPNKASFKLTHILLPMEITSGTIPENKKPIIDELSASDKVPPLYRVNNNYVNNEVRELLELIFRKFGNWSVKDLVNESKLIINVILETNDNTDLITSETINNKDIKYLWTEKSENEIVNFICKIKPKTPKDNQILNEGQFVADFTCWFNRLSFKNQKKFISMCNDFSETLIEETKVNGKQKIKTIWNDKNFKKNKSI